MNHDATPGLGPLFKRNREWAARTEAADPGFFSRLQKQQTPEYLWIGCADSRVPANEIVDLAPGELFVHRNVANVVAHSDLNCLSVVQFAVDLLKVKHVMVVGHYGCSGVKAAMLGSRVGLADNWLRHVQDVRQKHADWLYSLPDPEIGHEALCELNVLEQVYNLGQTTVLLDAWQRGQSVTIHALVYGLRDGFLNDLQFSATDLESLLQGHADAVKALKQRYADWLAAPNPPAR